MYDFERNKKMFWKGVKKESIDRRVRIKYLNGDMLVDDEKINKRWTMYFEDLLNISDKRKANLVGVANDRRMSVCERCNDKIRYEEFCGAIKKLKGGKSPSIGEITVEYLKKGGMYVMKWLARMFNGVEYQWSGRVSVLFLCLKAKEICLNVQNLRG